MIQTILSLTKFVFYMGFTILTVILGLMAIFKNKLIGGYLIRYAGQVKSSNMYSYLLTFKWFNSLLLTLILPKKF
jgi:hypothetical protein